MDDLFGMSYLISFEDMKLVPSRVSHYILSLYR